MRNQSFNSAAELWAQRNLVNGIEIEPLYNSVLSRIMVGSGIGFLALIFFGIPALIYYDAIVRFAAGGWSGDVSRRFVLGTFFLLSFMAFTAFILYYLWSMRRKQVRLLTAAGICTRDGKCFEWKYLRNLKFMTIETEVRGGFILRFVTRAMYSDVQKIKVEMFFSNTAAPAVIPPLIARQNEILKLLKTVPVAGQVEGKSNE